MAGTLGADTFINTVTTTQVIVGQVVLKKVIVGDIGSASWRAQIYDDTDGTEKQIADIVPTVTGEIEFNVRVQEGIRIVTTGTPGSFTIIHG